ncbi:hypothetical protein P7L75_04515 (plasmid) [Tistrella mobilis]|uniref:hypothetical protein n=1 Tax=Tistrella mobilis TaxID=171437 RepID=UPI0035589BE7
MIRYPVTRAALTAAVDRHAPTWSRRAKRRQTRITKAGAYREKKSIWSEIKPVLTDFQKNKCGYCERKLEAPEYGAIEWDIEHFRPKSAVAPLPDPLQYPHIALNGPGGGGGSGYYWLAYDVENYLGACKICNTIMKGTLFPVAGTRCVAPGTPAQLAGERAYLCHPLSPSDADPQDLITFDGVLAIPAQASGFDRARADLIISLFRLNDREELVNERARQIVLFGGYFEKRHRGDRSLRIAEILNFADNPGIPHASCVRAHARMWADDPGRAREIWALCEKMTFSL